VKSSSYLKWFRRLVILGAVVAAVTASAAGAVSRPPDVQDRASSLAGSVLVSPPDVQDAAASLHSTPQGLKADGLRLQGIANVYKQLQPSATPDAFERYAAAHPYGQSSAVEATRPPDVSDVSGTVDRGFSLGVPLENLSTGAPTHATQGFSLGVPSEYLAQPTPSGGGDGFNWSDWGIGIGSGIGIALLLGGGLVGGMQRRHRMQTA
jgi:hypothetical protein